MGPSMVFWNARSFLAAGGCDAPGATAGGAAGGGAEGGAPAGAPGSAPGPLIIMVPLKRAAFFLANSVPQLMQLLASSVFGFPHEGQ
jgi:hypothetical protein